MNQDNHKVLIFEDDLDLAKQWSKALESVNIESKIAPNMQVAEDLCKEFLFDLAIVDIFIVGPDGSYSNQGGISLLQYFRQPKLKDFPEDYKTIPKVAVTGSQVVNHFDMLRLAEDSGCHTSLRKPFSNEELVDVVCKLLEAKVDES